MFCFDCKKAALFVGGVIFGSAGFSLLGSRDAKRAYVAATAAALRCKEAVMRRADIIQENCSDILADAEAENARRAEAARGEVIEESAAPAEESAAPEA